MLRVYLKLTIILSILINVNLAQQSFYISYSEGNDSNSGVSKKSPWKTLTKLENSWQLINPGDSVLFKRTDIWAPSDQEHNYDGLIRPTVNKSGTPHKWIYIGAYGEGEKPIISSKNKTKYHRSIYLRHNCYIIIKDLKILGNKITVRNNQRWSKEGSHHIKFINLEYDGSVGNGKVNQILFQNSITNGYQNPPNQNTSEAPLHDIEIAYCEFRNNSETVNDMINVVAPDSNFHIHHNNFFDTAQDVIDLGGGKNHIVEYNIISGATRSGIKIHSQFNKVENIIVRGNFIIHCGGSKGNTSWGMVLQGVENSKIYNNTIVSKRSIWIGDREETYQPNHFGFFVNNEIFNNIFAGSVFIAGKMKRQMYNITELNQFSNNIYTVCPPIYSTEPFESLFQIDYSEIVGEVDFDYITPSTFKSRWIERKGVNSSELNINPQFIDPTWNSSDDFGDFHIIYTSPASDKGKSINLNHSENDSNIINYIGAFPPVQPMAILKTNTKSSDDSIELLQNFPNPFNPSTNIKFRLDKKSPVRLNLYNMLGELVKELINKELYSGEHIFTFHSGNLPSGVYVYQLATNNIATSKKLVILK